MARKQILLADNAPDFLNTQAEFLERAGYHVLKAFKLEEAQRILSEAHVHLAILDIRMVDDDDEKDTSGLTLAKNSTVRSIPKIMLTNFPTVKTATEALGAAAEGLPPAVDFVSKKDGEEVLIQAVEKAFAKFVKINWNLDIRWDAREPLSFPHLVSLLHPQLTSDILIYRASELEDLIRKLFFNYQHIRLGRLLWHDHQQFCLPVLMQSSEMTADLRILVCGDRQLLKRQQQQIEKLAPNALQRTELRSKAETMHFGANLYELRGADIEAVQTLRDLFQTGKERTLKIALAHLLGDVLKAWHQHGQKVEETHDLMSVYRQWSGLAENNISKEEVKHRVESLIQSVRTLEGVQIERTDGELTFRFPGGSTGSYSDPVAATFTPLSQYNAPVVCRISPGSLTTDNVLVDAKLQTWLTDFGQANQAPQWWDFICLEATIRFDLSRAPDFPAWQEFEECLMKPVRLDEGLEQSDVIPELRLSLALIEQTRRQVAAEAGSNLIPYYAGLLAWIVKSIVHYDPGILSTQDRLRGAHLLLSACMLTERLGTIAETSLPSGTLQLDENGRIWLGEQKVASLTGLRLKLLQYLIAQDGQIANNPMITENVYGEKYTVGAEDQNQRIRQEISRLREEIEPDPNRPRYILTERGRGYRLSTRGEPED
jgi:DNA-binding response OmpR family regulator